MKITNLYIFVIALILSFSVTAFAQHNLQVDDGNFHFSVIKGPTAGGFTYTIPTGGGIFLTDNGSGTVTIDGIVYNWPNTQGGVNTFLRNDGSGNLTWVTTGAAGVTSLTGTANQVLVNGTSGAAQSGVLTLTTPQDIGTGSSPTFVGEKLTGLTASRNVRTDGSSNLTTGAINLAGGATEVSGILPIANGGTNSSTALNNGRVMVSNTGSVVEDAAGTANQLLHGDLSWGAASLTNQVSGILPIANGGTNTSTAPNSNALVLGNAGGTAYTSLASTGTTTTLLHGNAAGIPSFGQVVNGDIANSTIDLTAKVSGILPIVNGGTNSGSALAGMSIMVSNGTQVVQGAAGTTTTVLHGNAAGLPSYGQVVNGDIANSTIDLTSKVTGILPIANGGTNTNTAPNSNALVLGNAGGTAYTSLASTGTTTTLLHGNAAGIPSYGQVVNGDIANSTIDLTSKVTGILPIANGGTNINTYATGDVLYASAANTLSKLTFVGTATRYLSNTGGAGTVPAWSQINMANGVTGVLPIANGGTNSGTALGGTPRPVVTTATGIVENNATIANNTVAKWSGNNFANSSITDDGSTVATTENVTMSGAKTMTLGTVSANTGSLAFANASSGFATTLQAGNATAAVTYMLPTSNGGSGNVLTTDGGSPAQLSWASPSSGTVAGSDMQIQFNNAGSFGAATNFIFDNSATTLSIGAATGYGSNVSINMTDGHLRSQFTTAPTGATTSNAGGSGSITLANATDVAGKITIHTQGGPSAGDQATVTFNKSYNVAPIVVITPGNLNAVNVGAYISDVTVTTTGGFTITYKTAGGNNTNQIFFYHVIETQ